MLSTYVLHVFCLFATLPSYRTAILQSMAISAASTVGSASATIAGATTVAVAGATTAAAATISTTATVVSTSDWQRWFVGMQRFKWSQLESFHFNKNSNLQLVFVCLSQIFSRVDCKYCSNGRCCCFGWGSFFFDFTRWSHVSRKPCWYHGEN